MARTVAQVIADARKAVSDPSAVRDTDAEIRGYIVDALNIIKTVRPDLFLGAYATDIESIAADANIPITGQYHLAVVMYVVSRIEIKDEESADRARGELAARVAGGMLA